MGSGCLGVALCLLAGCAQAGEETGGEPESEAAPGLSYVLDWDLSGVEALPEGGFSLVTDLGYAVTVQDGALSTWSTSLLSCLQGARRADHASVDLEGSSGGLVVEGLDALGARETSAEFDASQGCGVYWVLGAEAGEVSLWLEGTWRLGDGEAQPFTLESTLAWATSLPWERAPSGESAVLTLTRDPSHLLDGVDLSTDTGASAGLSVLANLGQHTTLETTP